MFEEIEKKKKKVDVYTLLFLRSTELSTAFGLRTLCYSKISAVMLLCVGLLESRENSSQNEKNIYALRPNAAYLSS